MAIRKVWIAGAGVKCMKARTLQRKGKGNMNKRIVLFRNNAGWQKLCTETGNILATGFAKTVNKSVVLEAIQREFPAHKVEAMGQEVLGESDLYKHYQYLMAVGRKG